MVQKPCFFCAHMEEKITPTKPNFNVSPVLENISLQCGGSTENAAKRRRLFSGSTKLFKTKTCRNCAERNRTLTKSRIFNVRENFAKTNQTVKPNLQGSLCVKCLTRHEHKEIESADPVGADKNTSFPQQ